MSDDEDGKRPSPGPGAYQTDRSMFTAINRPTSLQLFGSGV